MKRREIEARLTGPFVKKIEQELGKASTRKLLLETVIEIAKRQRIDLATKAGGQTLDHFASLKEPWTRNGALEIDVLSIPRLNILLMSLFAGMRRCIENLGSKSWGHCCLVHEISTWLKDLMEK